MTDPKLVDDIAWEVAIKCRPETPTAVIKDLIFLALQSHGDEVRRKTVEECAKVADELKGCVCDGGYIDCPIPEKISQAIRKLLEVKNA